MSNLAIFWTVLALIGLVIAVYNWIALKHEQRATGLNK